MCTNKTKWIKEILLQIREWQKTIDAAEEKGGEKVHSKSLLLRNNLKK